MMRTVLFTLVVVLLWSAPGFAYIDRALTLSRIIKDAEQIVVVEVDKADWTNRGVRFRKLRDLKARFPDAVLRCRPAEDYAPGDPFEFLASAEAGARAVFFVSGRSALIYFGSSWYAAARIQDSDLWSVHEGRPELRLAYLGSAQRLSRHVEDFLAGKETIVTTIVHGAMGRGSFADVVFGRSARIDSVPLQRIRVAADMPDEVYHIGADKRWFVGLGPAASADIAKLRKALKHADRFERQDAAHLLGLSGAKDALPDLRLMLKDEVPQVAAHAAAAIVRLAGPRDPAANRLLELADSDDTDVRVLALRLLAATRPPGSIKVIARQLNHPAVAVRRAAIDALGFHGADAEPAIAELLRLLPDSTLAPAVLHSLGQIGAGARSAQPAVAARLTTQDIRQRRRVAQAMALIGGPCAAKAIPVLVADLKRSERDAYNAILYLGVLGEHGKPALPALREVRDFCGGMASMAIWAIEPTQDFPWQIGYTGDRPCDLWFFATFVDFLGPRAPEAARHLVNAALRNTAGDIPSYAIHLLDQQSQTAIPLLVKETTSTDSQVRRRTANLLGRMRSTDPAITDALRRLSTDADPSVRDEARKALGRERK